MASETVDPIDWPHPPPYTGQYQGFNYRRPWQYPLSSTYCTCSSMRAANHKTYCTDWDANVRPSERQANALPVRPLRVWICNELGYDTCLEYIISFISNGEHVFIYIWYFHLFFAFLDLVMSIRISITNFHVLCFDIYAIPTYEHWN